MLEVYGFVLCKCGTRHKIAVYDLNPRGRKTIFFIHGWPVNHNMFEYQFNVLPKLGFRCISIDLRGYGNSDAPWDGYSYDRMTDDIYEVIRTINVPNMTLVGFSVGGAIAIRYMTRHRGFKISKLVLLSAAAPSFIKRDDYPYGMTLEAVNALITQTYRNRPQMLEEFGRMFFASRVSESFSRWFNSWVILPQDTVPSRLPNHFGIPTCGTTCHGFMCRPGFFTVYWTKFAPMNSLFNE